MSCIRTLRKTTFICMIVSAIAYVHLTEACAEQVHTGVFGTWGSGKDQMFQAAKDNDFGIVISSDVAKARSMGLKCLYPFSLTKEIAADPVQWKAFVEKVKTVVSNNKDNPTVFGWYLADEPDWNNVPPQRYKELNDVIKSIDNVKPSVVVLTIPTKWYRYLPHFDIIAIDPYLPNTYKGNETDKVKEWLSRIKSDFRKYKIHKPLWVVLGAFEHMPKSGLPPAFRKPTPQEFNTMLDTCLANDVSGILIFSLFKEESATYYGWNLLRDDPVLWDTVRKVPSRVLPAK